MRKIILTSLLIGISLFTLGCVQETETTTTQETVSDSVNLYIDSDQYGYDFTEGLTALSVLEEVAAENDITVEIETSDFGSYVQGIGEKTGEDGGYWIYYVNDQAASVGADQYEVKAGDKIEFKYEGIE